MNESNKKTYIVYGGDDIPYESSYPIASFLDKEKAEEFLNKLIEQDEKNRKLEEEYRELYNQYYEYIYVNNLEDEEDNVIDEAISNKFGVTKEFAHEVLGFYYYPQNYYIGDIDLYD